MEAQYYCNHCSKESGEWPVSWDAFGVNYTGEASQLEKYLDHSVTGHRIGNRPVSLLKIPDKYSDYMKQTSVSGHLEIDHFGRKNIIFYYSGVIGGLYSPATQSVIREEKCFKVVKPQSEQTVHGFSFYFPTGTSNSKCKKCGVDLWDH